MVEEPVEQADGRRVLGEEVTPVLERPGRADAQRASLIGCGDDAKEELGAVVVHRGEADLVDQDQVGFEDLFDHLADGVVGQSAIEVLDEVGSREVAHPLPASTAWCPRATRRWDLPVPAGPTRHRFSLAAIHSRLTG